MELSEHNSFSLFLTSSSSDSQSLSAVNLSISSVFSKSCLWIICFVKSLLSPQKLHSNISLNISIKKILSTPTTVFIEEGVEPSTSTRLVGAKSSDSIESRLKAMGYIK